MNGVSDKRNISKCTKKGPKDELPALFNKDLNPNLHIHDYFKYANYLNEAIHLMHHHPDFFKDELNAANIRFLQSSPDAPIADIYINNIPLAHEVTYKMNTEYIPLPPGKHQVTLYPAGKTKNSLLRKKITVEHGKSYTLAITGGVGNIRLIPFLNRPDVPAGEAKIRYPYLPIVRI